MRLLTMSVFLFLSLAVLSGCGDRKDPVVNPVIVPNTEFGPAPTVPSVTVPVAAATTQATETERHAAASRLQAAALTPENLAVVKPVLVDLTIRAHEGVRTVLGYLLSAQEKASQNDAAVAELKARLEAAQNLVHERESQMKLMADDHAAGTQALQKQITKLKEQLSQSNQKTTKWIFGTAAGLGMLAVIAGAFIAFTVIPRTLGLAVSGLGIFTVMLGTAGLYYGQQIAIGGLVFGAVILLGGIWAAIQYLRQDGQSIAQGLQQAIIAGKVKLSDIREHLDMAQTPGARKMVDRETKDPKGR